MAARPVVPVRVSAVTSISPAAALAGRGSPADRNFRGQVGTHYAGPTWESNSGSKVVARRLDGCAPNASAIPRLKLEAVSTEGPGIFDGVTFIRRVNTTGGQAPAAPGSFAGQEARVPYTAEYYFYRASN